MKAREGPATPVGLPTPGVLRAVLAPLALLAPWLLTGCATPRPPLPAPLPAGMLRLEGAEFVAVRVHHGIPILQRSLFWDGNGEVDDTGVGLQWGHFIAEDVALGVSGNATNWWTPGPDVQSVEIEGLLRCYPVHDWPLFVSGTSGYQLADHAIPPGGTVWNFSFGFGAGVDLPIAPGTSAQLGVDYHHVSNALGHESPRNPSQNEARLWVGCAWTF